MFRASPGRSSRSISAAERTSRRSCSISRASAPQGDLASKVAGGALGLGLSQNLRDAYTFICSNYCEGDEIFLFGFSRGAYTARSVGGLIGYAGLLGKQDLDRFLELWKGYKERDKNADVLKSFDGRHKSVPIKCLGVWDTVGAVGIPAEFAKFDLFFKSYYGFFDTDLGAHVEHAFHALALDERRKNFEPTLWTQTPGVPNQELKQVWFAGVHSDVGGGYPEHGASDIPLAWMASEVAPYLGIDFELLEDAARPVEQMVAREAARVVRQVLGHELSRKQLRL